MKAKPGVIAFITSYFPHGGGAEVALRQVASRLSEDFDFTIVTARDRPTHLIHEAAEEGRIWRLGIGTPLDKWLLPGMAPLVRSRLIKEESAHRTTVLWGMDITQASLSAAFLRRLDSRLPLVLTVQYGETPARLASGRLGMIRRSFKYMLSCADRVTAVSTSLLDLAREHGYTGPALLIPNGVDLGRFRRPEGQPSPPHPTVITVSRLVNKNGLETLLRALPMVLHEYPALECCVVGDGPQRPRLERLAAELGVANAVRFLGGVPHEDVPRHLWRGDVFVRPSRSEGMGTAFVEALAAGLPIIGTCVGGIADIIRDGETGLFAQVDEPADLAHKIRLLLADRGLAARLAEQGLAWVRDRYDAESVARRYSAVFEEALRG